MGTDTEYSAPTPMDTTADHVLALRQNAIEAGQYWRSNDAPRLVQVVYVYGNKVIVRGDGGRGAHEEFTRNWFVAAFHQAVICRGSSCTCGHYYTHHTIGTSMCTVAQCECSKFVLAD